LNSIYFRYYGTLSNKTVRNKIPDDNTKNNSFSIAGNVTVKITSQAKLRYRKPKNGKKKHRYETYSYPDTNKDGDFVNVRRIFDREIDRYIEVVTKEETGEIIHEKNDPLSSHYGHGSAKKNDK